MPSLHAVRCGACGSSAQTPPTQLLTVNPNHATLVYRIAGASSSMFGSDKRNVIAKLARVCLDCGTVALCLGESELNELRRQAPRFVPLP